MPLAEWVAKRNNAQLEPSLPTRRLTVQEAQALKFTPDRPYSPGLYPQAQERNATPQPVVGGQNTSPVVSSSNDTLGNAGPPSSIQQTFQKNGMNAGNDPANVFANTSSATPTQQQRNEGASGYMPFSAFMQRRLSAQSYPSTTSGHPDEDGHEPLLNRPVSPSSFQFARPTRPTPTAANNRAAKAPAQLRHMPDLSAQHKQDLQAAYQLTHGGEVIARPELVTGDKRKNPHENDQAQHPSGDLDNTTQLLHAPQPQKQQTANVDNDRDYEEENAVTTSNDTNFELDYDPTALVKMDFNELLDEPFDQEQSPGDSLHGRIQNHFEASEEEQRLFFNSLSFGEWEEAGNWFADKFKAYTDQLRRSREARREVASKFEDEVTRRHESVEDERTDLDKRLADMAQRGARVLAPAEAEKG